MRVSNYLDTARGVEFRYAGKNCPAAAGERHIRQRSPASPGEPEPMGRHRSPGSPARAASL